MEGLIEGDIVVVPFPFSDLSSSKRRPAVVIAKVQNDLILCQITSRLKDEGSNIILKIEDIEDGTLRAESVIRPDKIFTADKEIILYRVGTLKKKKLEGVKNKLITFFGKAQTSEITWKDLYAQRVAPILSVDIIIRHKGGIVLINRAKEPLGWAIPGGFVDFGETVEQAAIREAKEETNLDIQFLRQMHVYSDPKRDPRGTHTITLVFVAEGRGTLKAADDAAEAEVFSLDQPLPKLVFDHNKILQDYVNEEYVNLE